MDWTVEEALAEVIGAVEEGAAPLSLGTNTRKALKALFEEDFQNQLRSRAQWPVDKERVLPLARRIGCRAKLLTLDQMALQSPDSQILTSVECKATLRAAYYVCKTYQIAGRKAGPYCPSVRPPEAVVANDILEEALSQIRQSGHEI